MTAFHTRWRRAGRPLWLVVALLLLILALLPRPAVADDKAQLLATSEAGFARLVLTFPGRLDLPAYKVRADNGVLAVDFDAPIDLLLPDVTATLPDYVTVARVNSDRKGLRIGLRTSVTVNRIEAGELLFLDILPGTWQGMPPTLPPAVVAELAQRAKDAAIVAEQKRKAEQVAIIKPVGKLRVGRNPTFLRLQFDWNVDTAGKFNMTGEDGNLVFDWPVPVNLYELQADLPPELLTAQNIVGPGGSRVALHVAKGVTPRFYANSNRQFVVDIDTAGTVPEGATAEKLLEAKSREDAALLKEAGQAAAKAAVPDPSVPDNIDLGSVTQRRPQTSITPYSTLVGSTVRVVFPFDQDTPAAVFRRGDTLWMLFDGEAGINQPAQSDALNSLIKNFTSTPAGSTQVVRMELSQDKLATLGSQGRSWVLSLGDMLLTPTEPLTLTRRQTDAGDFEVTADLNRPSRVHLFRDSVVGDMLTIVTVFPPARGMVRNLDFVDFSGLSSVHGLVIKPQSAALDVKIEDKLAVIAVPGGLTVSAAGPTLAPDASKNSAQRTAFLDLAASTEADLSNIGPRSQKLMSAAAQAEGRARDRARLDLARFYLANQLAFEAMGVLRIAQPDLTSDALKNEAQLIMGAADTLAVRSPEALGILNSKTFSSAADALMWRTIARTDAYDFKGAIRDAKTAEAVISSYPVWTRKRFLLSATRAAVEVGDPDTAQHYLDMIESAKLDPDEASLYRLMSGRIADLNGHDTEAQDSYGQVIAADVRPYRAEAVYRTLLLLNKGGKIDLAKATSTLSAEAMLWRGSPLEADMAKLLAELYFRNGAYREGFVTVKQAVAFFPESKPTNELLDEARVQFNELFVNGKADSLNPVDALSIFYDFRHLTPPGAKGDEMIRNLAQRLVKVDLLPQAADLLRYQIDNRLTGPGQSQIAADLAVIEIADRKPEAALLALNKTRLADLPPSLERQRRILEVRALIDSGRMDLALDLLSSMSGRDVDLLRVDANWKSKRFAAASQGLEVLYSPTDPADMLSQPARMNTIKAAVGYVLANDKIGLSRLRAKFADPMSKSAEWPVFDFVTGTVDVTGAEFKKVVRQVSGLDSIDAFLSAYKQIYASNGSLVPQTATKPAGG